MAIASISLNGLSDEERQIVEGWLVQFDQSWSENRLAERVQELPPAGSRLRLPTLVEMAKIDIEHHWKQGRRISLESYLEQYPELGTPQNVSADLIQAEYEVRQQFDAPADLADFARRFPQQASRLRQLVVEQADGSVVDAPADQAKHDTARPHASTPSIGRRPSGPVPLPEQFGRYRILRRLGRGGMGTVYLAHDTQLDRDVALKVPAFAPDDGPEILERFVREAQAAATINHPNICPVYDVGEIDGTHFLTTAHIEGRPLSEFIGGDKPLLERQVATAVKKIALALEEAHQRGVIHRDLKPSNIMINKRREPVIMDFGLARRVQAQNARLTQSGAMLGTPAYMPPEQAHGDLAAMGPRCDIYSLGVILYELLTGCLPFDGPPIAVLAQILTQDPPPPSSLRPELDSQLEQICLKAMSKKADDRFASMAEFAAALTAFLSKGTKSPKPSQPQPSASPASVRESVGVAQTDESLLGQLFAERVSKHESRLQQPSRGSLNNGWYRRVPRWSWIAAAAAVVIALGGVILRVQTPSGTVQIELSDPNAKVEIRVDGDTIDIAGLDEPHRLRAGKHELVVTGANFETHARRFDVRRGEATMLTVELVPKTAATPRVEPAAKTDDPAVAKADDRFTMTVVTKTTPTGGAAQRQKVFIMLNRDKDQARQLSNGALPFQNGAEDRFTDLAFDYPLAHVRGVTLFVDGTNAWGCEQISLQFFKEERGLQVYTFPVNQAFSTQRSDKGATGSRYFALEPPPTLGSKVSKENSTKAQGIRFDGRRSYLEIANYRYDGNQPITLEAIVTPEIVKESFVVSNRDHSGVRLGTGEGGHWSFVVESGRGPKTVKSTAKVAVGKRIHIAGVFDGKEFRLYVDGKLGGSKPLGGNFKRSYRSFKVGGDPDIEEADQKWFFGVIEQVRISTAVRYEGDFKPEDILSNDDKVEVLLHLNEGVGTIGYDSSGKNNHATIVGAEWVR